MTKGLVGKFTFILLLIVLIVSILRLGFGQNPVTLSDLLYQVSNIQPVSIESIFGSSITPLLGTMDSWGIFAFLYPLVSSITQILDLLLLFCVNAFTVLQFIFYFVKWILVV